MLKKNCSKASKPNTCGFQTLKTLKNCKGRSQERKVDELPLLVIFMKQHFFFDGFYGDLYAFSIEGAHVCMEVFREGFFLFIFLKTITCSTMQFSVLSIHLLTRSSKEFPLGKLIWFSWLLTRDFFSPVLTRAFEWMKNEENCGEKKHIC